MEPLIEKTKIELNRELDNLNKVLKNYENNGCEEMAGYTREHISNAQFVLKQLTAYTNSENIDEDKLLDIFDNENGKVYEAAETILELAEIL